MKLDRTLSRRSNLAARLLRNDLTIVEEFTIPARAPRFAEIPEAFASGATGDWMKRSLGPEGRLYLHQAASLTHIADRRNVVLSTSTASGKSRVFMAAAIDCILTSPGQVLVFYPQKALSSDQLRRWQAEIEFAGRDPREVRELTGDTPVQERDVILREARIVLATPDVVHCWMMSALSAPSVSRYLHNLRLVVIDEAHALESVFGTNAAMFLRRLRDAKRRLHADDSGDVTGLQFIATTATLADPAKHLAELTGLDFVAVGEDMNGAPSHPLTLAHIEGPDTGAKAESNCAELVEKLARALPKDAAQIAFVDSRQGVERVIARIKNHAYLPYRGGYHKSDRHEVEAGLRSGRVRGVIATSALELGIDLPQFALGMAIGVPMSRKALRQRIGRIGRAREGVFLVVAPRTAFAVRGTSFREFATGPVEESPLYLGNEIVQFQHALCLIRELDTQASPELSPSICWPEQFSTALEKVGQTDSRNGLLDRIALYGADNPHYAFSLRSMPGESLPLRDLDTGDIIGSIDGQKALREAYPGATYIHFRRTYRVQEWRYVGYGHEILLMPAKNAERTQPILSVNPTCALTGDRILDGNHLAGRGGNLAELTLEVSEAVDGYRIGSTPIHYHALKKPNAKLVRRVRTFSSTGVLLQISEPWFEGESDHQIATRRAVANGLRAVLGSSYGVAARDTGCAYTSVRIRTQFGSRRSANSIVIFDDIDGGLRLSSPLYLRFDEILDRLGKASKLAGGDAPIGGEIVSLLRTWFEGLQPAESAYAEQEVDHSKRLVFAPGSVLGARIGGQLHQRRVIEPALVPTPSGEALMYRYENREGGTAWVAHDHLEAIGEDWGQAYWDPVSGSLEGIGTIK